MLSILLFRQLIFSFNFVIPLFIIVTFLSNAYNPLLNKSIARQIKNTNTTNPNKYGTKYHAFKWSRAPNATHI